MLIDDTLAELGRETGVPGLSMADGQPVRLLFPDNTELVFERCPDGVLMHLDIPVPYDMPQILTAAMQRAGAEGPFPYMLQIGMRETRDAQWLLLGIRATERAFTLRWIEHASTHLERWIDALRADFPQSFAAPLRPAG